MNCLLQPHKAIHYHNVHSLQISVNDYAYAGSNRLHKYKTDGSKQDTLRTTFI